jgi:hypothetical protein
MDVVGSDTDEAVETPMHRAVNAFHDTVDDLARLAEAGFLAGAAIDGVAAIGGALGGGAGAFGGAASAGGAILAGEGGGAAIIGGAVFAPEAILLIGVAVAGVAVVGIAMAVANGGGSGGMSSNYGKRYTPEQLDLIEMAKGDKANGGVTEEDMKAYIDLNREAGLNGFTRPGQVRGPETHPLRTPQSTPGMGQTPHGHVGPVDYIPVK